MIFEYDCDQRYKIHRNRVRSARAVINTAPPEDFLHFHYNAKKCMQQAERLFDVERANRMLLEKMTKYAEYNGAQHLRPWAARSTCNFKNGMVYRPGTGLHIDNLNVPVNNGTVAAGNRKTDYLKRKELEAVAKANLRIRDKIKSSKPVYSAQKLQHEYLENVSRIDRLSTFRGPATASHRSTRVKEHLEVAKSMRMSQHLPGTAGYQKELSRSMARSQSARVSIRQDGSSGHSDSTLSRERSDMRPPRAQTAAPRVSIKGGTGIQAYATEAARSMKRAATFSRASSKTGSRRAASARDFTRTSSDKQPPTLQLRPSTGRASMLLTPDASVTMLSGDDSRNGGHQEQPSAAASLMSHAPQGSLHV